LQDIEDAIEMHNLMDVDLRPAQDKRITDKNYLKRKKKD
jgi:hypothetical protein